MTHLHTRLLLADRSPCLRRLVLRNLLSYGDDHPEVLELDRLADDDPLYREVESLQHEDGSWHNPDTPAILLRLGTMGFSRANSCVERGAEYLFSQQLADGSWPMPSATVYDGKERVGYDMIPLQTALPLCGLCACGYADDERVTRGFEWLLSKRLPDGTWPTGMASGVHGYVAGYRRMPHSRWGCRSNTTGSLIALSLHHTLRRSEEARRALDLLLARETHEQSTLGFQTARTLGYEPTRGFFTRFASYDPGLIAELSARIGATADDERVSDLVSFITESRGPFGLWEYASSPAAARWVSYALTMALDGIEKNGSDETPWISNEPRTPFKAYERPKKRW